MKIRQAQTSATYILPDPGELNKRVLIRQRVDMPADNFGVESQYPVTFRTWAKVIQTSATTWQETAQTGDAITHYITIRYRRGITADYEVVCGDSVYRVKTPVIRPVAWLVRLVTWCREPVKSEPVL